MNNVKESRNESRWWKNHRSVYGGVGGNWFDNNLVWKVGTRSTILFWEDVWMVTSCLGRGT